MKNANDKPKPKIPKNQYEAPPAPQTIKRMRHRKLTSIDFETGKSTFQEPCILSNDPSYTAWGWVIIDGSTDKIIKTGCIKTKGEGKKRRIRKGDEDVQRTGEIIWILLGLIKRYNVAYILTELPHGSQNAMAAKFLGAQMAILLTLSITLGIGIEWYSEGDAKKCALGKISATKKEMVDAMDKIYEVTWTGIKYKDEAVADALAIHNVASKESSTLKLIKR